MAAKFDELNYELFISDLSSYLENDSQLDRLYLYLDSYCDKNPNELKEFFLHQADVKESNNAHHLLVRIFKSRFSSDSALTMGDLSAKSQIFTSRISDIYKSLDIASYLDDFKFNQSSMSDLNGIDLAGAASKAEVNTDCGAELAGAAASPYNQFLTTQTAKHKLTVDYSKSYFSKDGTVNDVSKYKECQETLRVAKDGLKKTQLAVASNQPNAEQERDSARAEVETLQLTFNELHNINLKYQAQKRLGREVLRIIENTDELSVMPIGRDPANIKPFSLCDDGIALMHSSYDRRRYGEYQTRGFTKSVSRFAGVLVFNRKTNGMCWIDFGNSGSNVTHTPEAQLHRERVLEQASSILAKRLVTVATDNIVRQIQQGQIVAEIEVTQTASEGTVEFIRQKAEKLASTPQFNLLSEEGSLAVMPFLPSSLRYEMVVSGGSGPISICPAALTAGSRLADAITSQPTLGDARVETRAAVLVSSSTLFSNSASASSQGVNEVPDMFMDPISYDIMTDPVVTPSGQIYDRDGLERWICDSHTHPETREPLRIEDLLANDVLRHQIQDWLRQHPVQGNDNSHGAGPA